MLKTKYIGENAINKSDEYIYFHIYRVCFYAGPSCTLFGENMYMLFTCWEVRIEKYFVEVSKTVRGRRPRDVFETETKYFSIWTDLNGKKRIYFFVEDSEANGNGFIRLRI